MGKTPKAEPIDALLERVKKAVPDFDVPGLYLDDGMEGLWLLDVPQIEAHGEGELEGEEWKGEPVDGDEVAAILPPWAALSLIRDACSLMLPECYWTRRAGGEFAICRTSTEPWHDTIATGPTLEHAWLHAVLARKEQTPNA